MASEAFTRIPFQSLARTVSQRLREAIVSGSLRAGDRLFEQKLAATFGVSQPTIREALKDLEYQGFVRKLSNKGTYVTQYSQEDLEKVLEVRTQLELLAISKAVGRIERLEAGRLTQIVEELEVAANGGDRAAFHRADLAFHGAIWKLAANKYLETALEHVVFSLFASVLATQPEECFRDAALKHRKMLSGLLSRDVEVACQAFLEASGEFWWKHHRVRQFEWVSTLVGKPE